MFIFHFINYNSYVNYLDELGIRINIVIIYGDSRKDC